MTFHSSNTSIFQTATEFLSSTSKTTEKHRAPAASRFADAESGFLRVDGAPRASQLQVADWTMATDDFELPTWKLDFERVVNRLAARLDTAFLRFGEAVSRTLRRLAAWIDDAARPHPVR